jgi:general secretion pathway protein D
VALLHKSLGEYNYAATVESGNILNIYVVDPSNTEIVIGNDYNDIPATKDLVTQIVYVHNVEANQLIQTLQPLMPAGTSMTANQGANAIVITDAKANIRRMAQLVKALDTSSVSASGMEVIPLQYADAATLAQVITQLFQTNETGNRGDRGRGGFPGFPFGDRGRGGDNNASSSSQSGRVAAPKVTAVADERSNSLVVSASADQLVEIRRIVNEMDVNVDDLTEVRVFRLRFSDPQETADMLTSLFPDPTQQQGSRNQQFGFRGFFGGGDNNNRNRNAANQNSRSAKQTRVTAVPDPRTGSVIVSASQEMMVQVRDIIEELDSDPAKKKKVHVIKVENRDPQEVVEELQSIIAQDASAGNLNNNRNSQTRQTGSQLNSRQQNNLQNQGNNNQGGLGNNNNR